MHISSGKSYDDHGHLAHRQVIFLLEREVPPSGFQLVTTIRLGHLMYSRRVL
jgi:hypothetical protein